MGNTAAERSACVAAARAAGISQSDIDAFLRESPGDECRLNSAFAPTDPSLGGQRILFAIPGVTSYSSPAELAARALPAVSVSTYTPAPAQLIQAPASSATPASTISSNSVVTGPAIASPAPVVSTAALTAAPAVLPGGSSNGSGVPLTAAPGAVMAPAAPAAATAPALASVTGDNSKLLMLAAAAVAAYWLWGR